MTAYLKARPIRIFDYPRLAQPLRDALRENAERLAAEHGLEIRFLRKKNFRKEDRVKQILEKRGHHPGLVCIFSAMEPCATYPPWHDKQSEKTYLRPMTASACTTTFISSTKSWAWGMFAFPPGAPSVFRSILTAITGWRGNCGGTPSTLLCSTMPSPRSPLGARPSAWPMTGEWRRFITSWTRSPSATVR